MTDEYVLDVAGRDIAITSPDKVFFAERGETKLDLVRYYLAVADPLMRAVRGRPTLMQRFPTARKETRSFRSASPRARPNGSRRRSSARRTGRPRARWSSPTWPTSSGQ